MLLLINKSQKEGTSFADIFKRMGIVAYSTTPEKALTEINNRYRAVIVFHPSSLPDLTEFVRGLIGFSLGAPAFALCSDEECRLDKSDILSAGFSDIISVSNAPCSILSIIKEYQRKNKLPLIGDYRLAGIDASDESTEITYFGNTLSFTPTEKMIIRYLIRAYPAPISARRILTHSYRASRKPELSAIRTHICGINRKFESLTGRKLAAMDSGGMGYIIQTPEVLSGLTVT